MVTLISQDEIQGKTQQEADTNYETQRFNHHNILYTK